MARLVARPIAFLPGGRVESGETLEYAMRRELKEEADVDNVELSYLGCIELSPVSTNGTDLRL